MSRMIANELSRHEILTLLDLSDGTYPSYGYLFSCLTLAGLTSLALSPAVKHPLTAVFPSPQRSTTLLCLLCCANEDTHLYIFKYCFNNNLSRTGETN